MRSRSSARKTIAALDRDCAAKTCQHIESECRSWNVRAAASASGQTEKSRRATGRPALPSTTDIVRQARQVRKVPGADFARAPLASPRELSDRLQSRHEPLHVVAPGRGRERKSSCQVSSFKRSSPNVFVPGKCGRAGSVIATRAIVRLDPRWNGLRSDPRFTQLVSRMRFPL
jgi:hypothetical protein